MSPLNDLPRLKQVRSADMRRSALQLHGAAVVGTFPGRDDVRGGKKYVPKSTSAAAPAKRVRGRRCGRVLKYRRYTHRTRRGMQGGPPLRGPPCRTFSPYFSVGAFRKHAGGMFLASDRSGYAVRRELNPEKYGRRRHTSPDELRTRLWGFTRGVATPLVSPEKGNFQGGKPFRERFSPLNASLPTFAALRK